MIYTEIDNFYLTEEQLQLSPSRKDGIDEFTETNLRIYGCDMIQESGILLKLPQPVMATGQVLFHRFYCKKSFAKFNVKQVAAACLWLVSKLRENPRELRQVIIAFHRMECRRENLAIEFLDLNSKKFGELKELLIRTERHILIELGFVCHVEHPHKIIFSYFVALKTPELCQEAWNLANDSLRTTLCVRFKSEVVACGVLYAAARRFQVPLPENPPWWKLFGAEKSQIDEVCRVLAHLYSLPKSSYISVCKDGDFSYSFKSSDSQAIPKDVPRVSSPANDAVAPKVTQTGVDAESRGYKGPIVKASADKPKDSSKSDNESKPADREARDEPIPRSKSEHRSIERDRDRKRERDRTKDYDRERGRERERAKDRNRRSKDRKDSGYSEKSRYHSSRYRDYHGSSYS